jgi:hypothetical protein
MQDGGYVVSTDRAASSTSSQSFLLMHSATWGARLFADGVIFIKSKGQLYTTIGTLFGLVKLVFTCFSRYIYGILCTTKYFQALLIKKNGVFE